MANNISKLELNGMRPDTVFVQAPNTEIAVTVYDGPTIVDMEPPHAFSFTQPNADAFCLGILRDGDINRFAKLTIRLGSPYLGSMILRGLGRPISIDGGGRLHVDRFEVRNDLDHGGPNDGEVGVKGLSARDVRIDVADASRLTARFEYRQLGDGDCVPLEAVNVAGQLAVRTRD